MCAAARGTQREKKWRASLVTNNNKRKRRRGREKKTNCHTDTQKLGKFTRTQAADCETILLGGLSEPNMVWRKGNVWGFFKKRFFKRIVGFLLVVTNSAAPIDKDAH